MTPLRKEVDKITTEVNRMGGKLTHMVMSKDSTISRAELVAMGERLVACGNTILTLVKAIPAPKGSTNGQEARTEETDQNRSDEAQERSFDDIARDGNRKGKPPAGKRTRREPSF